jgi:Phasin protein
MAKTEYQTERMETTTPLSLIPSGFIAMGKKHIHDCVKAQSELLDRFHEANRNWLDHLQSEVDLSTEFASKLTAVRSAPDAAKVLLDWTNRQMEMATVDAKHVLADTRKFMEIGARLLPGGWSFDAKSGDSSISAPPAGFPRPLSSPSPD